MTDFISFKTLKRPPKPNTCLAAPPDHCLAATPDLTPPELAMSGADLMARLQHLIAADRRWGNVRQDTGGLRLSFVATTPLLRFKDDIDVEVIPLGPDRTTLAIYSRSRLGYSDLGANRKRVEELISRLTAN